MNFRVKEKLILRKKIFFNAGYWEKDDLSIVFKKLELPPKK